MCIPGYFIPLDNGKMYVDGGILNNYPIDVLSFEEQKNTLGFTFSESHTIIETITSLEEFLYQIVACSYVLKKSEILLFLKEKTIILPCGEFPLWKFDASKEERLYLIECGRQAVIEYFNFLPRIPKRRYSVS
jgi:predicted acylesterase/phospholipase RssA